MSLLLPELATLGIFPGACWLQRGARAQPVTLLSEGADVLENAFALLDRQVPPLKRRTQVQVIVSDSLSSLAVLPWQAKLTSSAQLRSYAHMVLENYGAAVGSEWISEASFRHFGKPGLAIAMRCGWIEKLLALLAARGLYLHGVQPLTVAAYRRLPSRRGHSLVLLSENSRLTALKYEGRHLAGMDVQAAYGDPEQDLARLVRRLQACHGAVPEVTVWSVEEGSALTGLVTRLLPEATVTVLPAGKWGQ